MPHPIVTLTLNPAIDISCTAASVQHTHKVRTGAERMEPGGGGINAARLLHAIGAESLAVVAAGGVTGALVEDLLHEAGLPHRIIPVKARTRMSFTVHDNLAGVEYRLVPQGAPLAEQEWLATRSVLQSLEHGWLIASGSLPSGMPLDAYAQLARDSREQGRRIVVDSVGAPLSVALQAGVDLIKPSLEEFEALMGTTLRTEGDQDAAALALVRSGQVRMVAVTLGSDGALLATGSGVDRLPGLPVPSTTAVGAGDSFLGGLVHALARGRSNREALAWGVAAGTATVACSGVARVQRADVEQQFRRLWSLLELAA